MQIKGFDFQLTCRACPEQYDVYDPSGRLVFYVRYRHGYLTCNPYNSPDDEFADFENNLLSLEIDSYSGSFDDDEQREEMLTRCLISYMEWKRGLLEKKPKTHKEIMEKLNKRVEELLCVEEVS